MVVVGVHSRLLLPYPFPKESHMNEIVFVIEAAKKRQAEQESKVSKMNAQLSIMKQNFQKAQEAVNNEIIELAVRNRLLEELIKIGPKEGDEDATKEPDVLGNNGRDVGSEHSYKLRGQPINSGTTEAPAAHAK